MSEQTMSEQTISKQTQSSFSRLIYHKQIYCLTILDDMIDGMQNCMMRQCTTAWYGTMTQHGMTWIEQVVAINNIIIVINDTLF